MIRTIVVGKNSLPILRWKGIFSSPSGSTTGLVGCWSLTSLQNLRSYDDGYRLVIVHTHGDFIVLAHWESRPPASWPGIPLSHIILTLSHCPILLMAHGRLGSDKYQFDKSLGWLDQEPNSRSLALEVYALPIGPLRPGRTAEQTKKHLPNMTHVYVYIYIHMCVWVQRSVVNSPRLAGK